VAGILPARSATALQAGLPASLPANSYAVLGGLQAGRLEKKRYLTRALIPVLRGTGYSRPDQ